MHAVRGHTGPRQPSRQLVREHHVYELRHSVRGKSAIFLLALQVVELDRPMRLGRRRNVDDSRRRSGAQQREELAREEKRRENGLPRRSSRVRPRSACAASSRRPRCSPARESRCAAGRSPPRLSARNRSDAKSASTISCSRLCAAREISSAVRARPRRISRNDHHCRAQLRERERGLLSDPGRCAGDHAHAPGHGRERCAHGWRPARRAGYVPTRH